jgi:hypothetical protein
MALLDVPALRGVIRFRGDYQNVRKFPDADIDREIQSAFENFYQIVADTNQGWFDTTVAAVTVANQAFVTTPADAWRVLGLDLLDGADYVELWQVGLSDRNRFGTDTDQPVAYRLTARGADLYPTPNTTYTLRFVYTPRAPILLSAQQREWYNGWDDYVVEAVLLELDKREGKPLSDRMATLTQIEKAVRAGAGERRQQEPEYLPLREASDDLLPYERGVFR